MKKEYTNGEVTVVWQPGKCIHSGICANGLPKVFKPKEKPWVDADAASTQQLIDQIRQCPSGALSYYMNDGKNEPSNTASMSNTKAQVIQNGPLMVSGEITVEHADGQTEMKKSAAFCRCGHSGNKPFCDGSHKAQGFKG